MAKIHLSIKGNEVDKVAKNLSATLSKATLKDLEKLGISISDKAVNDIMAFAMNAAPNPITQASIQTPLQFLQYFFPRAIKALTKARTADRILGKNIAGAWEDEQLVIAIDELTGQPVPYSDWAEGNLASYNRNYETRNVVRFKLSAKVNALEEARAGRANINEWENKREAVAQGFAIGRNKIAYNGYANSSTPANNNKTYGLLNDPNLPAYVNLPNGVGGSPNWAQKTVLEIVADLLQIITALQARSAYNFDPATDSFAIVISGDVSQQLNKVNDYNLSAATWLKENYPRARVEIAPELNGVNGGVSVLYAIVDSLGDNEVIGQYIQVEQRLLGIDNQGDAIKEISTSATAGTILKQPVGVVRFSGLA